MRNNRGSALISALFIMTLVAIAATAMSTRLQKDIKRVQMSLRSDQLYLAHDAVTGWAMNQLAIKNPRFVAKDDMGRILDFPKKLQNIYPGVVTEGHLFDLQARFNLNNLSDIKTQTYFYHLLENTLKKSNDTERTLMVNATKHWITPYQPGRGHDELEVYYTKQKPPYYPAYQPMQHVSEFRMIKGISQNRYDALLPSITTLPEATAINLNTASKTVLMALGDGLNESQVNELQDARGKKGFANMNKINPLLKKLNIPIVQLTVESSYFLSVATTSYDDMQLTVYTLINRHKNNKGEVSLSVVSERINSP